MPIIDDRGRLFGRINLIDAAVGAAVVVLIPLAYLAYALFHQPQPRLVSVEPALLTPKITHVRVTGENLRPFLRVSFGNTQGVTFALIRPDLAEVRVPDLAPGKYDVVLYDVSREIGRLPDAVTVEGAPRATAQASVILEGAFVSLDDQAAAEIKSGAEMTTMGSDRLRVLAVGAPEIERRPILVGEVWLDVPLTGSAPRLPAVVRASCNVVEKRCRIGGSEVAPDYGVAAFSPGGKALRFVVHQALVEKTGDVDLAVRFIAGTEAQGLLKAGDHDRGPALLAPWLARIASVGTARRINAQSMWRFQMPTINTGDLAFTLDSDATVVDATLQVPVNLTADGLRYRSALLKVGGPFLFETDRYTVRGIITRMTERAPVATDQQ